MAPSNGRGQPQGKDQGEDSVPHVGTTNIQATLARLTSVTKQEFLSIQIVSRMSATLAITRTKTVSVSRDIAKEIQFVPMFRVENIQCRQSGRGLSRDKIKETRKEVVVTVLRVAKDEEKVKQEETQRPDDANLDMEPSWSIVSSPQLNQKHKMHKIAGSVDMLDKITITISVEKHQAVFAWPKSATPTIATKMLSDPSLAAS